MLSAPWRLSAENKRRHILLLAWILDSDECDGKSTGNVPEVLGVLGNCWRCDGLHHPSQLWLRSVSRAAALWHQEKVGPFFFVLSSCSSFFFLFFFFTFLVLHESLAENVGQIKATADVRPALPIPSSVCSIIFFFFKLFSFLFPSLPSFFFFLSSLFPSSPSFYFFRTHLPLPPPPLSFFLVGLFLLLLLDLFFPSFFPHCSAETPETWFYDVVLKSHKISEERKLFFVFFYSSQSAGVLILFQMLFKLLSVCFIKTVKRVWFCHWQVSCFSM